MKYKIEKGIPIPPIEKTKPKSEMRIALESMEVGDCIEFSNDEYIKAQGMISIISTLDKKRFSVRTMKDGNQKTGSRIWRVS